MSQRGINKLMIEATLEFGDELPGKNSTYFFLGKRGLKRLMEIFIPQNPSKWEGLVVVYDVNKKCFITCFKNKNWPKNIRH